MKRNVKFEIEVIYFDIVKKKKHFDINEIQVKMKWMKNCFVRIFFYLD